MFKVGILGAGNIAKTMARTLHGMINEDVELYAIASSSMDKSQRFAKEYGAKKAYGSYEDLVNDENVDLIYVATIHTMHYEHAKLCIEHGKPVLVEKPFTLNADLAKSLFDLAKEKNVFICEGMWTRFMPSASYFSSLLENKTIGKITSIQANIGYDLHDVPRMIDPSMAGGALLDVGIYPIHFAMMVLGSDIVSANGQCLKLESGVDGIDSITLGYKDSIASIQATMLANTNNQGCIFGDKGYVIVDNINNPHTVWQYAENHALVNTLDFSDQITGFEFEIRACRQAIENGHLECEAHPHEMSLKGLSIMDKLRHDFDIRYPEE